MLKNGTPASPATARASSVLPVPGGPKSSTPLGMRAPSCWNFLGFSRNSLISWSSSTASSTPATSLNVTLGESTLTRLARLLPKLMTLEPPPCIWFIMKIQKTMISTNGSSESSAPHHGEPGVFDSKFTLAYFWMSCVVVVVSGYCTVYVTALPPPSGGTWVTCSVWSLVFIMTDATRPFCKSLTKLAGSDCVMTVPIECGTFEYCESTPVISIMSFCGAGTTYGAPPLAGVTSAASVL